MKSYITTIVLVICISIQLMGQTIIKGKITDKQGVPLPYVSILVKQQKNAPIIGFGTSNNEGLYTIQINHLADSLWIETQSVSYEKQYKHIVNQSQEINFQLKEQVFDLEGVIVKAQKIDHMGDTISYLISALAKEQDRSLGEVLKHIPGIEVRDDGKIYYDDMPLKKFYVEGLDLMKGRYGVITNNLPYESVSTVELMKNHQPIKMLKDKFFEEQASINVKLKKKVAVTGTGKVGGGYKPLLWEVNLTPMIFTKKYQFITSYQTNNVGEQVSQQMNTLTMEDANDLSSFNENFSYLSLNPINLPQLEQQRILDNNVHFFNVNGLTKLNNDMELSSNIYYLNDYQQQYAHEQRTMYLPNDTLMFTEQNHHRIFENRIEADFNLLKNAKKNYLNNTFSVMSSWDMMKGDNQINSKKTHQSLHKPTQHIANNLKSISNIGKHLMILRSQLHYTNKPHDLQVFPGQFLNVFNNQQPYTSIKQKADVEQFFTNNSISFAFTLSPFTITPDIGFQYQKQGLNTIIFKETEQQITSFEDPGFKNKFTGHQWMPYIKTNVEYKRKNFTANLRLPIEYTYMHVTDDIMGKKDEISAFNFNPGLYLNYKFAYFWRLYVGANYKQSIENLENIHYGYILRNFDYLAQNDLPLSKKTLKNAYSRVTYNNSIVGFTGRLLYRYSIYHKDIMLGSKINEDGTSITKVYHVPNHGDFHFLEAYISQYFSDMETNINLKISLHQRNGKSLVNEQLVNTQNKYYILNPSANVQVTHWLNMEYNFLGHFIQNFINQEQKGEMKLLKHKIELFAFPTDHQLISLSSEYYNNDNTHNFFLDLSYRYTIEKPKIDFDIRWNNILNTKNYISYQSNGYIFWASNYQLRPSQILASIKFNF